MRIRTGLIVLGCWSIVAVVFTVQQLAISTVPGSASHFIYVMRPTALFDLLWAAITFGMVALIDRMPPSDGRNARFIAIHAALSVVAAIAQLFAYNSILAVFQGGTTPFPRLVAVNLPTGIFIYWLVLATIVAVAQRERAHERRRIQDALERNLDTTRAAMLRAQLQPHFLFNTLNTIAALIPEEPGTAERMVARLGDLLRISLDETRAPLVSLAEDLSALDAYLAIEMLRLGDRLRIVRDIAPETRTARVPDLLLQPIAENAIRHGLAPTRTGGTLTIRAMRDGEFLRIDVADDGVGAMPEAIRDGIGLRNTRERIALMTGHLERTGLAIHTTPGSGFAVTITLPWVKE